MLPTLTSMLTSAELDTLENVASIIKPFHDLTLDLGASSRPTISLVAPRMHKITKGLTVAYTAFSITSNHQREQSIEALLCSKLLCGLKKGWNFQTAFESDASKDPALFTEAQFLVLASLLHPLQRSAEVIPKDHHNNARAALLSLLKSIHRKLHPNKDLRPVASVTHPEPKDLDFYGDVDQASTKRRIDIDPLEQQLTAYLDGDISMEDFRDPDNADSLSKFDFLRFWKAYAVLNKDLADTVRVVLAITASTIPSESSFSTLQLIVDRLKTRRLPSLVDDLAVCFSLSKYFGRTPTGPPPDSSILGAFETKVPTRMEGSVTDAMSINEFELPLADDDELDETDGDEYSQQEINDALRTLSLQPVEERRL